MTTFTTKQIDALTEIVTGAKVGKSPTKDKAIARFGIYARQNGIDWQYVLDIPKFENAEAFVTSAIMALDEKPVETKAKQTPAKTAPLANTRDVAIKADVKADATANVLVITTDDTKHFKTLGGGQWSCHRDGCDILVKLDKDSGNFTCTVNGRGREASARTRGYVSSIRKAVSEFNGE